MTKTPAPNDTKATAAWCTYDWANSAFTTLVVSFIYAVYFAQAFAADENVGTALWSRGIVVSSILIALLAPILGALADRGGTRRRYLITATIVSAVATSILAFIQPGQANAALIALSIFVIANVAFEIGMVFYNSFLPTLASPEKIGRISGYGWGVGYLGGLACLVIALFGFIGFAGGEPLIPLSRENGFNIRATNFLVAGWFLVFSIPMFLWVRDRDGAKGQVDLRGAFRDIAKTFHEIRQYREVVVFLLARLVYNDGLVTIFAFGGIYAMGTFGMTVSEVALWAIALNVAAGTGAFVFGVFDDKLGGKKTVLASLVALLIAGFIAVVAPNRAWFWVASLGVGIFAGPNQSASRSLMGRFVPPKHQAEFFGFYAFSGKATAFLGPLLLGILSSAYGQRAGFSVILLFFILGGAILLRVNEQRGLDAAARTVLHSAAPPSA